MRFLPHAWHIILNPLFGSCTEVALFYMCQITERFEEMRARRFYWAFCTEIHQRDCYSTWFHFSKELPFYTPSLINVEFQGDMRNTTERRRRNKEGNKIIQVKIGNVMKGRIPTAKWKKNSNIQHTVEKCFVAFTFFFITKAIFKLSHNNLIPFAVQSDCHERRTLRKLNVPKRLKYSFVRRATHLLIKSCWSFWNTSIKLILLTGID